MNIKQPSRHLDALQDVLENIAELANQKALSEFGTLLTIFDIYQIIQANVEFRERESKTVKVTGNALGFEQVVIINPHEVSVKEEKV